MDKASTWHLFWAKTDREGKRGGPDWVRPLWAHLIDVASAAELIWERVLPASTKARLAAVVNLSDKEAGHWLSLQIGLHDIGKAIPCFQTMHDLSRLKLEHAGLPFKKERYEGSEVAHHGHASIPILIDWLSAIGRARGWSMETIEGLAATIGFHHGKLVTCDNWMENGGPFSGSLRRNDVLGYTGWQEEREKLLDAVTTAWGAIDPLSIQGSRRKWPAWLLEFAGWCTLADWLGSMEECYPDDFSDMGEYLQNSREGAGQALEEAGFSNRAALRMREFGHLFRTISGEPRKPRPLQNVVIEKLDISSSSGPTLTIIEAPTGEGKTEASLYLALRQQAGNGPGIYIAMPSQATSNGLFGRVKSFIQLAHDGDAGSANLVLVHGTSALHPEQEELHQRFIENRQSIAYIYDGLERRDDLGRTIVTDSAEARVETASWFMPKKRSLLAPYGVGTVDQALLSVLFAKHFFLRQIGLAGKTVVFDEVHAYDTYMNALFHRLLVWLRQNGTNVIILSATLPELTRCQMMDAWNGTTSQVPDAGNPAPYPVVWHTGGGTNTSPAPSEVVSHSFAAALSQSAFLHIASPDVESVASAVICEAREGAAIAVIVNTVARAQKIFRCVLNRLKQDADAVECYLFHARFPYELRNGIETQVLQRFGPGRPSGSPAILVATQVAEQSLDIDVDVMFSDLAPIDLLLQRAGRLHRHNDAHKGARPAAHSLPHLNILVENAESGMLPDVRDISGGGHVYNEALLYRTWHLLRERTGWSLPDEYRALIEGVYSSSASNVPDYLYEPSRILWEEAEKKLKDRHVKERMEADGRMIPEPEQLRVMVKLNERTLTEQDDAPAETHPAYLALTRLGGPSFDVVCLHEDSEGRVWLDQACTEPLPLKSKLMVPETRRLMECSVRLSGNHLVPIARYMTDKRWSTLTDSNPALLRYNVMIFRDGHWRTPDAATHFKYDTTYGIIRHTKEA